MSADKKDGNNVKSIIAVKQKYIQSLVVISGKVTHRTHSNR